MLSTVRHTHILKSCRSQRTTNLFGQRVRPRLAIAKRLRCSTEGAIDHGASVFGAVGRDARNHDATSSLPPSRRVTTDTNSHEFAFVNNANGEQATLELWQMAVPRFHV